MITKNTERWRKVPHENKSTSVTENSTKPRKHVTEKQKLSFSSELRFLLKICLQCSPVGLKGGSLRLQLGWIHTDICPAWKKKKNSFSHLIEWGKCAFYYKNSCIFIYIWLKFFCNTMRHHSARCCHVISHVHCKFTKTRQLLLW